VSESTHWRLMFPTDFLAAPEFKGKDVALTIKAVSVDELPVAGKSTKDKRAVVRFEETPKKLVLNKTNAKTIARLLGNETAAWVGKRVTLYPTTTKFGPDTVDCIRVRDALPPAKDKAA
jgi:hypothetical protein